MVFELVDQFLTLVVVCRQAVEDLDGRSGGPAAAPRPEHPLGVVVRRLDPDMAKQSSSGVPKMLSVDQVLTDGFVVSRWLVSGLGVAAEERAHHIHRVDPRGFDPSYLRVVIGDATAFRPVDDFEPLVLSARCVQISLSPVRS